jgi:hypothetical protein
MSSVGRTLHSSAGIPLCLGFFFFSSGSLYSSFLFLLQLCQLHLVTFHSTIGCIALADCITCLSSKARIIRSTVPISGGFGWSETVVYRGSSRFLVSTSSPLSLYTPLLSAVAPATLRLGDTPPALRSLLAINISSLPSSSFPRPRNNHLLLCLLSTYSRALHLRFLCCYRCHLRASFH